MGAKISKLRAILWEVNIRSLLSINIQTEKLHIRFEEK
jgi:hypothetical protein